MIYSFDVFDTIVGRKVLIPEGVFFIMQERMLSSEYFRNTVGLEQIQQFAQLRKKAELIDNMLDTKTSFVNKSSRDEIMSLFE